MSANSLPLREELPTGKTIMRRFGNDGTLIAETHSYGTLEIAIEHKFSEGAKSQESYIVKKCLASRRSYEKHRSNYSDMPPADATFEDWGGQILQCIRKEQRQNKTEREKRLAESAESRFQRPTSTNWLRVIAENKAHLVVFASRDWKILSRESALPTGREWLRLFGFFGPPGSGSNIAKGVEIGFEVPGNRAAILEASKQLLAEVALYVKKPQERTHFQGSIRPRPKPRPAPVPVWPNVLPPLIEFLSSPQESEVKIFNHHQ